MRKNKGRHEQPVALTPETWPDMPLDYTCGCGLHVHPDYSHTNPKAIHCSDCPYRPA